MNRSKGFNLIELMVVIAIIAILASVALPMYSQFKRQSRVAMAVKVTSQSMDALQAWWEQDNTFEGMTIIDRNYFSNGAQVGVSIGEVSDCTFTIAGTPDESRLMISWTFTSGCDDCSGRVCLQCENDVCSTEVRLDDVSFGFNQKNDPTMNPCI